MKVFSFKGGDFWRVADGSGLFVTVCMVTLFTHLEKPLEWVVKFDEMRFRVYGNYPHSNKLGLQDRTTKRRNQQEVNGEFSSSNSFRARQLSKTRSRQSENLWKYSSTPWESQTSQRAFCRDFRGGCQASHEWHTNTKKRAQMHLVLTSDSETSYILVFRVCLWLLWIILVINLWIL